MLRDESVQGGIVPVQTCAGFTLQDRRLSLPVGTLAATVNDAEHHGLLCGIVRVPALRSEAFRVSTGRVPHDNPQRQCALLARQQVGALCSLIRRGVIRCYELIDAGDESGKAVKSAIHRSSRPLPYRQRVRIAVYSKAVV